MPKGLRGKRSGRDLKSLDNDDRNGHDDETPNEQGVDLLHPSSANFPRPSTSHHQQSKAAQAAVPARPPTSAGTSGSPERPKRLSLLRARHASDPLLSSTYRAHAPQNSIDESYAAPAPMIGVTAPPKADEMTSKRSMAFLKPLQSFRKRSFNIERKDPPRDPESNLETSTPRDSGAHVSFDEPGRKSMGDLRALFATAGTNGSLSKSSGSKFKFPARGRKKTQDSLFPLPSKTERPGKTGKHNTPAISSASSTVQSGDSSPVLAASEQLRVSFSDEQHRTTPTALSRSQTHGVHDSNTSSFTSNFTPADLAASADGDDAAPLSPPSFGKHRRSRTGTMSSLPSHMDSERVHTPVNDDSGRTSTASTTIGRNSIAGLRSLTSRLRHPSEIMLPRRSSPANGAPGTPTIGSFSQSQETLVLPERFEGETAGRYYGRLEEEMPKKSIALMLSKSSDNFNHDVLRSLMRTFKFYEEPMDVSLRKFLWEIDLPGEAQQIDRVITSFAERYHECNPHIFDTSDEAYFVAYSLIILHSDLFNRNNRSKMQRHQYQKNTGGQGVPDEILGYFYDNISYTEFLAQNPDDVESLQKQKTAARKVRKAKNRIVPETVEEKKVNKLDPYEVILSEKTKLDVLRPSLKDVLNLDEVFNYMGSADKLDMPLIRRTFTQYGILQIISARSRPEAYTSQATTDDPTGAPPGVIDIRVAKVGIIWRKDEKRRKTRSKWQKWGAILTPSQLYFFRDAGWVENLHAQATAYYRHNAQSLRKPCVFKPALEQFRYDANVPLSDAVALKDTSYQKHKHAFTLARRGTGLVERPQDRYFDEVLLADNETEMNDWLAKINYAASHNTTMVGLVRPTDTDTTTTVQKIVLRPASSASDTESKGQIAAASPTPPSDEKPAAPVAAGAHTLSKRVLHFEEASSNAVKKLNENLKTARHLQILAPFPERTRRELLAYGARLSHNIKWSRYDVWRFKCYRDFLVKDVQDNESGDIISGPFVHTDRIASPVEVVMEPSKPAPSVVESILPTEDQAQNAAEDDVRSSPSLSAFPETPESAEPNLLVGIDRAFETPADLLSLSATPAFEGSFRLPPLSLSSRGGLSTTSFEYITQDGSSNTPLAHQNSVASAASSRIRQSSFGEGGVETPALTPTAIRNSELQGSIFPASERDRSHHGNMADGRKQSKRRSMQRTLREVRDINGSLHHHHSRSKRARDSTSTVGRDDSPARDVDGLTRKGGSFTVHGKKASVVTLGSEWANISAEERLRTRQQTQTEDQRSASLSKTRPVDHDNDEDAVTIADSEVEAPDTPKRLYPPHLRARSSDSALFVDARASYHDTDGTDGSVSDALGQDGMPGGWRDEDAAGAAVAASRREPREGAENRNSQNSNPASPP